MNNKRYQWIIYAIAVVIFITITVQFYWNYKEYQVNKSHLISEVQSSLDNAVETYYVNLTKSGIITYTSVDSLSSKKKIDTIIVKTRSRHGFRKKIDSTLQNIVKLEKDKPIFIKTPRKSSYPFYTKNKMIPKSIDSLISKVFISISKDSLNLNLLDTYLTEELQRKNININYALKFSDNGHFYSEKDSLKISSLYLENFPNKHIKTVSKSSFLPHRSKLELFFTNTTLELLKNSIISILLSLLLSASIIASVIYLLKTIYKQKQLAEVKNDLISNITHEFKTPIATIATVLEAMKNFNVLEDKEKSEKYVEMASSQTEKLHLMVEKLLETATLKQEEIELTKQPIIINQLLEKIVEKYKLLNTDKTFNFSNKNGDITINVDAFHFENAIANIIDNAIKYGGNTISTEQRKTTKGIEILIWDNGIGIPKNQKDKVFEQFYRIPTGNTHNIKGFGIGLYYAQKIIEKHHGDISIIYNNNNNTVFKIELLNE